MVTQHRPCVLGPKQAAPLQNRPDFAGEHVELRGQYRGITLHPSANQILYQISDLFRGAGGNEMATRSGQILRRGFRHMRGEHRVGMPCREAAAIAGRSRLHEHRPALRAARDVEGSRDGVENRRSA
jgi:hypothetical protein